ncbi:MAG TPA: DUF1385 domain-containing protein [Chthonomonadaceae bacterium]|nr:DUF1385 domain-containing protein [Chthonomonadaceae bacterium]
MSKTNQPVGDFLQYGGQAVIEGVMMRSPRYFAVACRRPDGQIVVRREEIDKSLLGKLKWLNKPLLRGTLALVDAMVLGTRALAFASSVQMEAQQKPGARPAPAPAKHVEEEVLASAASMAVGPPIEDIPTQMPASGNINDIAIGGTIAFSFLFGIALFLLLPTALTDGIKHLGLLRPQMQQSRVWLNILDGLIRMAIFFGYIGLISLMAQIREVFMYHGAEHKAINTLEAGQPLTPANALQASRIHPRCGTSFIFVVLVVNLIVFAFLPRPPIYLRFPLHLAVIPIVAGLAYEVIKFAGRFRRNPVVMSVFAPGMWSQYLTTREPNEGQIEVALAALRSVLEAEGRLAPQTETATTGPTNPAEPEAVTA